MTEPDVDAIAPCVETAVLAGDFCLKRIAAVRAVVENLRKAANAEGKEIGA
ncbi:MAG: hypothetical protein ING19_20115 [Azospirillum sp.]|nr:hypothetical protein [Azospirillum sp.]